MESIRTGDSVMWHWPLLLSVFVINICLPNLTLSYGVILVHLSDFGVPLQIGFITPAILILTYNLTQCWFREAADSWGASLGYRMLSAVGLLILVAGIFTCAFLPLYIQIYVYGVVVGLGTSLISAQVDVVLFETYDSRLNIIRAICATGQAVGVSIFPHIIHALIKTYGYPLCHIVYAGIILQTLPLIMFLKVDKVVKRPVSLSRYGDTSKTYAIFNSNDIDSYFGTDLQLNDMNKKHWKSPSDDNLHRREEHYDDPFTSEFAVTITPPPSPEEKRKHIFGVDILPDIPEESEMSDDDQGSESDEHTKRFNFAIKRLSTLGDHFDECISNQIRRDSQSAESRVYTELEVTYDNISPVTDVQREQILNSFSFRFQSAVASIRRRLWMPSYRIYDWRRRLQFARYRVNDTFLKPLYRSLSYWKFYPSLLLSFARLSLIAVILVSLPTIAAQMQPRISMVEANFSMSLYAFTWICFLLSTPWLVQTKKSNFIHVTVIGLFLSTAACFLLSNADNHDSFTIGCVVGGLGFGAISTCWEAAVQDFVGVRKWPKINSTLETISGFLLAAFVNGIGFIVDQPNGLKLSIFILANILCVVSCIWLTLSLTYIYTNKIKYLRISKPWPTKM